MRKQPGFTAFVALTGALVLSTANGAGAQTYKADDIVKHFGPAVAPKPAITSQVITSPPRFSPSVSWATAIGAVAMNTIAAAATVLILFSIVLLLTLEWLRGRSEKMRTAASAA